MYAIEVEQTGGPEVLSRVEKPRPSPGSGEVLIEAEAIGVNFVDTHFRSGLYPHELPFVLGIEVAGTVAAVGENVSALEPGQRVATADSVAAYTEYCVAPANLAAAVPDAVGADVAAAVMATVRQLSCGQGVAAIYDGVGKSTFDASLASLAVRGTLVLFGAASGPVPPVDPQRLNAAGSVYLTRPSRLQFVRTRDEFTWRTNQLFDAIAAGTITATVSGHYPLKDAAQAHRDLEGRKTVGSVLLIP